MWGDQPLFLNSLVSNMDSEESPKRAEYQMAIPQHAALHMAEDQGDDANVIGTQDNDKHEGKRISTKVQAKANALKQALDDKCVLVQRSDSILVL